MKTQDSKKNKEWDINKWYKVSGVFTIAMIISFTAIYTAIEYFALSENIVILAAIMALIIITPVHIRLTKQLRDRDEDTKWHNYTLLSVAELVSVAVASQITNALISYIK